MPEDDAAQALTKHKLLSQIANDFVYTAKTYSLLLPFLYSMSEFILVTIECQLDIEFLSLMYRYGTVIISELLLPVSMKTIKPVNVGAYSLLHENPLTYRNQIIVGNYEIL